MLSLSCGTWDLFFVATCGISSCSRWILNCGMWDLVPWPGIEPGPPALETWSLSHWEATPHQGSPSKWSLSLGPHLQAVFCTFMSNFIFVILFYFFLKWTFSPCLQQSGALASYSLALLWVDRSSSRWSEQCSMSPTPWFSLGCAGNRVSAFFPILFFFGLFLLQKPYSLITRIHFYDNN